jgi:hypothetical protein
MRFSAIPLAKVSLRMLTQVGSAMVPAYRTS